MRGNCQYNCDGSQSLEILECRGGLDSVITVETVTSLTMCLEIFLLNKGGAWL